MELIALQVFFAFMILIISGAIAYEVVQLLASFWDPIVDAWNSPRPKPKWRVRRKNRANTSTPPPHKDGKQPGSPSRSLAQRLRDRLAR